MTLSFSNQTFRIAVVTLRKTFLGRPVEHEFQLLQASSRVLMSILPRSDKTPFPSKKMS